MNYWGHTVIQAGEGADVIDLRERWAAGAEGLASTAARRSQHAVFAAILAAHDDRLRALAYHLLGSRDAMDDVLQEVYLKVYDRLSTFRGEAAIDTWLHRITYTTCIDRLRRTGSAVPLPPEEIEAALPAGEAADDNVALRDELHRALAALDPEQCAAVLLVLRDGHTYDDAAEILGVPRGTVASRVASARERLARSLSASKEGGEQR